jgi:hypothetical protein
VPPGRACGVHTALPRSALARGTARPREVVMNLIRDTDIRSALRRRAARLHSAVATASIVEELGIAASTRADILVLNGRIEGYEIKSDVDSLVRLPHQVPAYEAVCDRVWIVTTNRFVGRAAESLPDWWGILEAVQRAGDVRLIRRRAARAHRGQQSEALLGLLWRRELIALCEHQGVGGANSRTTAPRLREMLAATRSQRQLADDVRSALLARRDWRAVTLSGSGDEPSPRAATRSGFRRSLPPHRSR